MSLTANERRSIGTVAAIYASRMLGLFMVLPVLSLFVGELPGLGIAAAGIALGIYGLTQAVLQIPFGMLSDRIGRRSAILLGLALFLAGSLVAAAADSATMLIFGRALQGAGAIAGVLLALVSELTAEQNRSRAMAAIGATIGLSFGVAMIFGPLLSGWFGLRAVFYACALLAAAAFLLALLRVPATRPLETGISSAQPLLRLLPEVLRDRNLLQLNFGIFVLHAIQMSMWVAVPVLLERQFGLPREQHWWFYLVVVGGSFIAMLPVMIFAERRRMVQRVFVFAVAAILLAQLLAWSAPGLLIFVGSIFLFFFGFNLQEARLPALVSRLGPAGSRGTAMSIYSTCQFAGVFAGGAVGGLTAQGFGLPTVFLLNTLLAALWIALALTMKEPANVRSFPIRLQDGESALLDELQRQPGVIDITVIREYGEAFLRADMDRFDRDRVEALLGRPL